MTAALVVELAWKSTLALGLTLAVLHFIRHRSAAERSWLAHAGLLVTLLLPLAHLSVPRWEVEAPAPVAAMLPAAPMVAAPAPPAPSIATSGVAAPAAPALPAAPQDVPGDTDYVPLLYAIPAALLLALTAVAILRLFALRRRASVLVENSWLSALAQAQRRMGFKHGTALLVSSDIASPVSWGVLRPVILLNEDAVGSREQAEAIIAHELAHVARFDWAKLLLARVATAVFWFNPLVWLLAKQCHQLREESADDAVLASDVSDIDYAQLLVGVARHESNALLLAANGVAPGRNSLAQRVSRVLDTGLQRAPARLGWAAACTAGALIVAAPLAALSLGRAEATAEVRQAIAEARADAAQARRDAAQARIDAADAKAAIHAEAEAEVEAELAAEAHAETEAAVETAVDAAVDAVADVSSALADVGDALTGVHGSHSVVVTPALGSALRLPSFNAINIHGGGEVVLRHGPQSVRVVGGDPAKARIAVADGSLSIAGCTGHCNRPLRIEVVSPRPIEALAINGGGMIEAQGAFPRIKSLAAAIMGGGSIDIRAMEADEVAAAVKGGGAIETRARRELAANVLGGGSITYWGDPEVASAVSHGGIVERGGN